jgi:L-aspartate oxidase
VDLNGQTTIKNLYACGECVCTGLHGANRLASNSLLEALVLAHQSAMQAVTKVDSVGFNEKIPDWKAEGTTRPKEMVLITQSIKELKEMMTSYVGIVRSDVRLARAKARLKLLYTETEELYSTSTLSPQLCELRNLITIGYLVTRSAGLRKESRGLHYTTDHPSKAEIAEDTIL